MAEAISVAQTAFYAVLSADTTLMGYLTGGLYQDIAPAGVQPPYGVIGVQSPGNDVHGVAGFRFMAQPLIRFLISGPQSLGGTIAIAYARADLLLDLMRNTNGIISVVRQSPLYLPDPELINGEPWVNHGGLYRVQV